MAHMHASADDLRVLPSCAGEVCGFILFGVGTAASFVLGAMISIVTPARPAARVVANAVGSEVTIFIALHARPHQSGFGTNHVRSKIHKQSLWD